MISAHRSPSINYILQSDRCVPAHILLFCSEQRKCVFFFITYITANCIGLCFMLIKYTFKLVKIILFETYMNFSSGSMKLPLPQVYTIIYNNLLIIIYSNKMTRTALCIEQSLMNIYAITMYFVFKKFFKFKLCLNKCFDINT